MIWKSKGKVSPSTDEERAAGCTPCRDVDVLKRERKVQKVKDRWRRGHR